MSKYQFHKAMRVLDHAIDHLGITNPCGLLVVNGSYAQLPATSSNADSARAVLVSCMLELVKEA